MSTLRTFQNEIEEIQHAKLHRDKENVNGMHSKGKDKEASSGKDEEKSSLNTRIIELEERIQTLLLSKLRTDQDAARDLVATLITHGHGEYVFRLGAQPPSSALYSGELTDTVDGWQGISRPEEELEQLRRGISRIVEDVGGRTSVLFESKSSLHPRISLLLRLPPPSVSLTPEVRVAIVGNVDAGKSTTLGVLTRGTLDDGRGKARVTLFRHKHEIETGRTSSVGMEILGFGPSGAPILPNVVQTDNDVVRLEKLGWQEISIAASKLVTFIDLAGHERYLKTTLYGMTSESPSCVILMIGANAGPIGLSKEHLAISLALSIPVVVCITKIDMTPPNVLAETLKQITKILKSPGCRKVPVFVKSMETAVELATSFGQEKLCPLFQISNVTGEGLDLVRTFLNLLPSSELDDEKFAIDEPLEYSITEVWSVPYVGTVVNGILHSGKINAGDPVWLGPDSNGNYQSTVVKTMQRKRAPVTTAMAGQCVSFALKRVRRAAVRKGMVILQKTETPPPKACKQFDGQVLILYHNTTLQKNYQAMLHCGAVRQTVRIVDINPDQVLPEQVLRTGDRATVRFEFMTQPEFVKEGDKLIFREGRTKGLGVITRIL